LALADIADEVVGTLARLFAYVGTLALLAILSFAALDQLLPLGDDAAARGPDWAMNDGCAPPSVAAKMNYSYRSMLYIISQSPDGDDADPGRQACNHAGSPDWLAGTEKVQLRGSL
jgi:hypothetical protein